MELDGWQPREPPLQRSWEQWREPGHMGLGLPQCPLQQDQLSIFCVTEGSVHAAQRARGQLKGCTGARDCLRGLGMPHRGPTRSGFSSHGCCKPPPPPRRLHHIPRVQLQPLERVRGNLNR